MEDLKHIESRLADDFEKVANAIKQELNNNAFKGDIDSFKEKQIQYKYLTKLINRFNNAKEGAE